MTQDRIPTMTEDQLDARLVRYLQWESDQLRETGSGRQIIASLTGATVHRGRIGRATLAWAVIALALVAVAIAVMAGGGPGPLLSRASTPPPSSPIVSTVTAPATPKPSIEVAGTCGTGRTEILEGYAGLPVPAAAASMRAPQGSRIAIALENGRFGIDGHIIVAGPEAGSARVIAYITGEDIMPVGGVGILGWSESGDAMLVYAGSENTLTTDKICGNLFVLQADGSAVKRLTDNGPAEPIDMAALGPGGTVAYAQAGVLHVVVIDGGEQAIALGDCSFGAERLEWAADGRRVLVVCGNRLVVADLGIGTAAQVASVNGSILDAVWSKDGRSIVAANEPLGGPVTIIEVDPVEGTTTQRSQSDVAKEWVGGTPTLSRDGRWLLIQGNDNLPDYLPTYVVDTATGTTTVLPWPVLTDSAFWIVGRVPSVTWLGGNGRVLADDGGTLYEVDLVKRTRTAVGWVPTEPLTDWALFTIPR
jgi:hypothetical protein